jgi:hypothetical protein
LEDLEFDVEIHCPHPYALGICRLFSPSCQDPRGIAKQCWEILNATYFSDIVIQYPTHVLAYASVIISFRIHNEIIPPTILDKNWLKQAHVELEDMLRIFIFI